MAIAAAGALPLSTVLAERLSATSSASSQRHGFDFLVGRWSVRHRKLKKRLAGSHDWFEFPGTLEVAPILSGLGNFDRNDLEDPNGPYEAHSLRLYNPGSDHWSVWWLDGRAPSVDAPVIGRFAGNRGTFYSEESFDGRPIRVRTTYEPVSRMSAEWTQAFSADGGRNWETNWIMEFMRART